MKQTLFIFALLGLAFNADAQIFKSKYQKKIERAGREAGEALRGGADFIIDPIEAVPVNRRSAISPTAQTNWGVDYLLTPALKARIKAECKHKVTIKVYDTGEATHPALVTGRLPGSNYTGTGDAKDKQGHGTHVMGIIAADGLGLCDALADAGLLSHKAVKVLSDNGSGSFAWVANAVAQERTDDKARLDRGEFVVCNGSFGGGSALVESVETELKKSTDLGVLFLFAAGNTGGPGVNYPGNGRYSIACASLDKSITRSSYSTTGIEVWAAMPGRDIQSTYLNGQWATLSGTSMATPFLTGAAAIAYSKWGDKLRIRGLDGVRSYLAWCAKDLDTAGKDNNTGWGIELISNILDRDPSLTPPLPGDPTPPPPPPAPPSGLVSVDPLPVALKGEIVVVWDNVQGAASKAKSFKTAGPGSRKINRGMATKQTKVLFEIVAKSTADSDVTAKGLEAAVVDYFKNRGFMLPPGQDQSWAALWAAYFLEMGLAQGRKWDVDVSAVTFKTADGQTIRITDLKHWPQTK